MSRRQFSQYTKRVLLAGLLFGSATTPLAMAQNAGEYTYDALGRVVRVDHTNGRSVEYDYDAAGNRVSVDAIAPTYSVANASATEGAVIAFTITRSSNTHIAGSVDYATSNGTASSSDYTATSGTASFAVDETSKIINVPTTQDSTFEANETLTFMLSNAAGSGVISAASATGTINNDDTVGSFSVNNVTVTEGGNLTFTVTKSGTATGTHNIDYATANNTASAGSDYTAKSGTLSFAPSDTSKTVVITTINDSADEDPQTFYINLSNVTGGGLISDSQGVGTINDNDPGPSFSVNNTTRFEDLGSITFTVTKTGATEKTHALSYTSANGTAFTPVDYIGRAGTTSFPPGTSTKYLSFTLVSDTTLESDEIFYLNLSAPTNSATISDSQGIGTIYNDDCAFIC